MKRFENKRFGEERALYHLKDIEIINCKFDGIEDGESAIKECENVTVKDSYFNLRYALWCVTNATLDNIEMTELARSSIWYSKNFIVNDSILHSVKLFRMCENIEVNNSDIDSIEFAWNSKNVTISNCKMKSEYPFLHSSNVKVTDCVLDTKYPFQQASDCVIKNTTIDAKDAFWDSKNITCINCTLKGDFLAWYSDGLTLIDCTIISSQPLCYATNLKLHNCVMEHTDLAFEYSEVEATIKGSIPSIKNPSLGHIAADKIEEVILGGGINKTFATIVDLSKKVD